MSVLSKALCVALSLVILSGCSTSSNSFESDPQGALDDNSLASASESSERDAALEQVAQAEGGAEVDAPQVSPAFLEATSSEKLIAAQDAGFDLQLERGDGFTRLRVNTSSSDPLFNVFSLENPPRIVLDLLGETRKLSKNFEVANDPYLKSIRLGSHNDRSRVVFDLTELAAVEEQVSHSIDNDANTVLVTFADNSIASANNNQLAAANVSGRAAFDPVAEAANQEAKADETIAETDSEAPIGAPLAEGEAAGSNEEVTASTSPNTENAMLENLTLTKEQNSSGKVLIQLTAESPYVLKQTSQSEYVLSIPATKVAQRTMLPQIGLPGTPGIRTVRAVQDGEMALVRMFTDPGVSLRAVPRGKEILITATPALTANQIGARAQAKSEGEGGEGAPVASGEEAKSPASPVESVEGKKAYTGRLISLDLQDTDIDNALRIIAEVSNLNIVASEDVTGKVTLRLIDVPWDQALDLILKTNGLDKEEEGNVIRIAPVEKLRQERIARKEAKQSLDDLADLQIRYLRVSYARVTDIKEQVESVLTERGTVTVDERTNQVVVKDIARGQEAVAELVKKLDLRTPQVLLETQIVEAGRNVLRDLGFQWNFLYSASPETGNATGMNFPNSVIVGGAATGIIPGVGAGGTVVTQPPAVNFPAAITAERGSAISALFESADGSRGLLMRLTALETEGKVKVISRPQVATVNNKQAEIKSVETVRVRLPDAGTSIATGSGASAAGGGSSAFEEIDVGIELRVTPQASADYYVLLDVTAKSSTFGRVQVDNIPSTLEREATSSILVKSSQTFALGGVYRIKDSDGVNGVPFLKDVPFFGFFFRNNVIDKSDEELIFFITPHIVEGSFDPSLM